MNNPDPVLHALLQAGRPAPPSGETPPWFAARVMQQVRQTRLASDPEASWAVGLWRFAFGGLGVAVLAGCLFCLSPADPDTLADSAELPEPDLLASALVDSLDNGPDNAW